MIILDSLQEDWCTCLVSEPFLNKQWLLYSNYVMFKLTTI